LAKILSTPAILPDINIEGRNVNSNESVREEHSAVGALRRRYLTLPRESGKAMAQEEIHSES
jgi:hypothetical protein